MRGVLSFKVKVDLYGYEVVFFFLVYGFERFFFVGKLLMLLGYLDIV